MTDTASSVLPLQVHLLWIPEAFQGTLFSSLDVLRVAASILHLQNPQGNCPITWKVIASDGSDLKWEHVAHNFITHQSDESIGPERTLIVIPGIFMLNLLDIWTISDRYPDLLTLLNNHQKQGGLLAVTFNGIIFPARAGLLDGARIGLHWSQKSIFTSRLPRIDFTSDAKMDVHNNIYTCVAPADQTEFMLNLIGELFNQNLKASCSHILQFHPDRQLLSDDITQKKLLSTTSNSPVFRAREWIRTHPEKPYRLSELASIAAVSERTLLRHFKTVVGMSPLEYLHEQRIERAKILLEVTLDNLHTIAQACGYSSAPSLHRLFQKSMTITPTEYRKRFTLRTSRKHWRVETIFKDNSPD